MQETDGFCNSLNSLSCVVHILSVLVPMGTWNHIVTMAWWFNGLGCWQVLGRPQLSNMKVEEVAGI